MYVKEHYDSHLAYFYSWMAGDFDEKQKEHQQFLTDQGINPQSSKIAIDLGAGHGIQSVSLAKLGFKVKAIDFNRRLLDELTNNGAGLDIEVIEDNIRNHYCPVKTRNNKNKRF
jgi:2-polyprenyl-3-methyl-5-hydroxy-6-metoxy-1,4-benzoquinol methylase